MIHITEGSIESINIEILSKAINSLTAKKQKKIILYTSQDIDLPIKIIKTSKDNNVINSIEKAINSLKDNDVLLTLPASKSDFNGYSGHTEYFRNQFNNPNITMVFQGLKINALLLTDHIPINKITEKINTDLIVNKLKLTLSEYQKFFHPISEVIFSGINPHAGESGLLGKEEKYIVEAIKQLKEIHPEINFQGPIAADTIHFNKYKANKLFVFAYHDQGLGIFKTMNKLYGANITLGLPFLRVSPDHGTAPDLKGKNQANYLGLYWILDRLLIQKNPEFLRGELKS